MAFYPHHLQLATTNKRLQAPPPKLVMTLNNSSDGDSTLKLGIKKCDEESGISTATTETVTESLGPRTQTTQITEKSVEFTTDGGFEGWTCVIGGWFALFATFGWLNS